jgi:hypothetical protein
LERRYRRVLRLLPPGYRRRWEEDMVAAFMEGAHASNPNSDGVPVAERLSVMSLAVRTRLSGSHATPRGVVWRHVAHGVALMSLLYQSLAATLSVGYGIGLVLSSTMDAPGLVSLDFLTWSPGFSLLWVTAFAGLVMGHRMASRVLVVLALASTIGVTVATYHLVVVSYGAVWPTFGLGDVSRLAWLAVSVVTVFMSPPDAHASRRFWFGVYLVGSLLLTPIALLTLEPIIAPYGDWIRFGNLTTITSAALIIAMAVVLRGATPGRRPSPHWPLALAAFAGGIGGIRLMMSFAAGPWPSGPPVYTAVSHVLDAVLVSLALACTVVGLLALRRLPGRPRMSRALARDQR